ncbi:MAG: alginate lyase family protein [Candidatus Riflebacteria bacterium]
MTLKRLFNTVKYLKPVQVYGRVLFALRRRLFGPAGADYESRAARELKRLYHLPAGKTFRLSFLQQSFEFTGQEMRWNSSDWQPEMRPEKLWLYHLNYFKWLFDQSSDLSKELKLYLILDWIEKNPSAHQESWEPFPLGKRLKNWIKWLENFKELAVPIRDCIVSSIYSQTLRLHYDLEYHNQANHLFENLTSLLVAALFLTKNGSPTPFKISELAIFATRELTSQINEQFLGDGGHYERSPMYHCEMLEALNAIRENCLNHRRMAQEKELPGLADELEKLHEICQERISLAQDWLMNLTHPDGMIAQFGDSVIMPGIKASLPPIEKPISYLMPDSGFFIRRWHDNFFAMSCKEPFPAYQPGHSHCDIMSYELSVAGFRCLIDTGCGSYQNQSVRQHCRRTSSHNVPLIELCEQSEIWGSFRIGARARVIECRFEPAGSLLVVEILDQFNQRFHREVVFADTSIRIRDRMYDRRLTGTFCSMLHLHPDCQIVPAEDSGKISFSCHDVEFTIQTTARMRSEPHLCYPDFGLEARSARLILSNHQTEAIDYVISWNP